MTALTHTVADSATMSRRNLRRLIRYPSLTLMLVAIPVVFLLLFSFVFGGTMGAGLGDGTGGRDAYVSYITPVFLIIAVTSAVQGTAIVVAMDMTQGIVARFRTMAISRASVLVGHVVGSLVQSMVCVAVVLGVTLLIGYRPDAGPAGWAGAVGFLLLLALALCWLCVALGLSASSVETASNSPMLLTFLPFLGSGFVPTDSMPTGLRWFAEYQPFTPITDTLRDLLSGSGDAIGTTAALAVAWCLAIGLVGYIWAMRLYRRDSARRNAA